MDSEKCLDRMSSVPLGVQLKSIIRDKIVSGGWSAGSMIPSENKLSEQYGISRMTVRAVISQFVSQGLLYRIPGKGTFVSREKYEITQLPYAGLRNQLEMQGHFVKTRLISCEVVQADDYEARKLSIHVGDEVYLIRRTRETDDAVVSFHESMIPVSLCPEIVDKDLQNEQLCNILRDEYLFKPARVYETLESAYATRDLAEYFGVEEDFPLILLKDQLYSADGITYEFSRIYFRGDQTKIRVEYTFPDEEADV